MQYWYMGWSCKDALFIFERASYFMDSLSVFLSFLHPLRFSNLCAHRTSSFCFSLTPLLALGSWFVFSRTVSQIMLFGILSYDFTYRTLPTFIFHHYLSFDSHLSKVFCRISAPFYLLVFTFCAYYRTLTTCMAFTLSYYVESKSNRHKRHGELSTLDMSTRCTICQGIGP